jgi:type II secretory pathway component PulM
LKLFPRGARKLDRASDAKLVVEEVTLVIGMGKVKGMRIQMAGGAGQVALGDCSFDGLLDDLAECRGQQRRLSEVELVVLDR